MRWDERVFIVLLVFVYLPGLHALSQVWSSVDYYSHGYLVPVVSLWAARRERNRWQALPAWREWRGLGLLLSALLLYAFGLTAGNVSLQGLSLVACAAGTLWFLRGFAWLRALAFPVFFLVFMVPLPSDWLTPVIVKLQLFVSKAAVAGLHALEVAVVREGNVIVLPGNQTLFVAEACSGVTSLVTLLPLAVFLAYFTASGIWRRAVLIAAVVPIAMFGNLLRVVVTVGAALRLGVERATRSALHDSAGLFTFLIGCLLLVALGVLLQRVGGSRREPPRAAV